MATNTEQDKGFFEKLGEILNAPLPGAEPAKPENSGKSEENSEDSILDRVREILSQPLPGTRLPEISKKEEESVIEDEDFSEKWWDRDWELFKQHQDKDRQGFNMKQRKDQESFARYQELERTTFDDFQRQEFEMYQQHQQWKMNVWQERMSQGESVEPPPWSVSVKASVRTPFGKLPPWVK